MHATSGIISNAQNKKTTGCPVSFRRPIKEIFIYFMTKEINISLIERRDETEKKSKNFDHVQ